MITSVPQEKIVSLLCHQLESFFPLDEAEKDCLKSVWGRLSENSDIAI